MRKFLAQDNSSHWYLVEAKKRKMWDKWVSLDEDDEASWDPPAYAERLSGSPERIEFENPKEV